MILPLRSWQILFSQSNLNIIHFGQGVQYALPVFCIFLPTIMHFAMTNLEEKPTSHCENAFANLLAGPLRQQAENIKHAAHTLHDSVNQKYDTVHPYSIHLDAVVQNVIDYAPTICTHEADVLPIYFAAYFHDSIEDARLTYNDVMKLARQLMTESQAYMATEIVYALTNEKGRTRAERANDKYYAGIRQTPYAPFVKLADRLANIAYSVAHAGGCNTHMRNVYRTELPHFITQLTASSTDSRLALPSAMIQAIEKLVATE